MTDISKHPLLKACYEACLAIEKLGCSPEQTDAVSRVSDMMRPIEALVSERDAALDQVVELSKAAQDVLDGEPIVRISHNRALRWARLRKALSNTSAIAQRIKKERENGTL